MTPTLVHRPGLSGGFVLPAVLGLILIMASLGAWFLFSTVHSKNISQVFFYGETARIIAESAHAEWRATLVTKHLKDPKWQNFFLNPKSPAISIPLSDLPLTKKLADSLAGAGQWCWLGKAGICNVDNELLDVSGGKTRRGAFGQEYQGVFRFEASVGLRPTSKSFGYWATFAYEFDLKHICMRSMPQNRTGRGYTSTALNDYLLYVRDGQREFDDPAAWAAAFPGTLSLGQSGGNPSGQVFLGGANAAALAPMGKFILVGNNNQLTSTPPNPSLVGRTGAITFARFLPFAEPMLQGCHFANAKELLSSPICADGVMKLNGVYLVRQGITIPNGLKFSGQGVIVSTGDIRIEGNFRKNSPTDGPCILYTWTGDIYANTVIPGRIEASLVALRYNFDSAHANSPRGTVRFSGRKADVLGNLVVDRLNLDSMSATQNNRLTYDGDCLSGDERYSVVIGGQIRRVSLMYNAEEPL